MRDPSGIYGLGVKRTSGLEPTDISDDQSLFSQQTGGRPFNTLEASMLVYEPELSAISLSGYTPSMMDGSNSNSAQKQQQQQTSALSHQTPASTQQSFISHQNTHCGESYARPGTGYPNDPHPLLDSTILYHIFGLKPSMLALVERFYDARWKLAYPLQRRLPFGYGIQATWADLLFLTPYAVAFVAVLLRTTVYPSVLWTGRIARYGLIAALVLAQRNSLFTFIIGLPIDRALFYHKLAGRFAGVAGILHTVAFFLDPKYITAHRNDPLGGAFTGQINASGSMIMIFIIGIVLSSLPYVRNVAFEVFFYLHYVFILGLVGSAFFHSGVLIPILAWLLFGIDLLIRKVVMGRIHNPRVANLRIISDSVVELSFPKPANFVYNMGQYAYIVIPEISRFQSHPFSISSAPSQTHFTMHIRSLGQWTTALHKLAQTKSTVSIFMEGPYGNLTVDLLTDRKYKSVMLISGGIGDQLLYEHSTKKTRKLNNLTFVWIERDPVLIKNTKFREKTNETSRIGASHTANKSIAEFLLGAFPQSMVSDKELDDQYKGSLLGDMPVANPAATGGKNSQSAKDDMASILDMRIYYTGGHTHQPIPSFAKVGRPDIRQLFFDMREKAIAKGDKRVAVCVSAPSRLREVTHKACILFSDEQVRFDFHTEVIEN